MKRCETCGNETSEAVCPVDGTEMPAASEEIAAEEPVEAPKKKRSRK